MMSEGFPAVFRLRKRREFLRVQNGGHKHHTRHFLVFVGPAPGPTVRLGITVTRKVGPAVVRNRIKRLVREAFRRKRGQFASPHDMVWVAKQSAATVRYDEVVAAMDAMCRRLSPRPSGPGTTPGPAGPGTLPGSACSAASSSRSSAGTRWRSLRCWGHVAASH